MLKQICPFSSTVSIIDKLMKAASITEMFLNFFFFFSFHYHWPNNEMFWHFTVAFEEGTNQL